MIRKITIFTVFVMVCAFSNAQSNMPSALDKLAMQCQEVVALNDTINARQNRLDLLKGQLEVLTQNWWRTCNNALSSPACDDNDTRISTLNELIRLTDKNYEKDLYSQLMEAKSNPSKRSITIIGQTSPSTGGGNSKQRKSSPDKPMPPTEEVADPIDYTGDNADANNTKRGTDDTVVNPIKEEQSKEDKSKGKEESSTSPESQNSKKDNTNKDVPPAKKNDTGKDKTKIESKDETNRNKTIKAVKDKLNKNK